MFPFSTRRQSPPPQNDTAKTVRFGTGFEPLESREVPAWFVVTTPADVVDPNDGVMSLREAVAAANAEPGNDQQLITFALAKVPGQNEVVTLDSQLTFEKNIYLLGSSANNFTIQRNAAMGDFRLFEIAPTSSSIIANVKLRGGKAVIGENGGAVLNRGDLTVTGCIIRDSQANRGGGIATAVRVNEPSTLTIYDTTITSNTAVAGGGIAVMDGNLTASNGVEISLNTSSIGGGGGIYINKTEDGFVPQVSLTGIYITQNTTATSGGGINCEIGNIVLTGGSVTFNTAGAPGSQMQGGGVFLGSGSTLVAYSNPTFSYNTAFIGDGLYISLNAFKSGNIIYTDDSEFDANPA